MSKVFYEPKAPWIQQSHLANFMKSLGIAKVEDLIQRSQKDPVWFWEKALKDIGIEFTKPYSKLLAADLPWPKWVEGAEMSIVDHCIDRHLKNDATNFGKKPALIFEGDEPGSTAIWTFEDLARESSYIAEELRASGAKVGDRAALLMPMSLEMVASFFGILRAGLTVIPIFSGYGGEAIASRLQDGEAKFIFVQEKTLRRGKEIPVRKTLESILGECPSVKKVFILKREDFLRGHRDVIPFKSLSRPAESECLLLYTSGTTGKPKACVHTPFGVLATTGKELRYTFDVKTSDKFFWYTDIGWMMGPWEILGVLQFGATVVLFEGVPDYPDTDRLWKIIHQHEVTHLGISPTAIRVLKKSESEFLKRNPLNSLRILGSTGEPWDEESWIWFFEKIGQSRCPIMNISGGTEIMGCLLMPHPFSKLKPASLSGPGLGVNAQVFSEDAKPIKQGLGHLVCLSPLPSMTKGFLNSKEKYLATYFEKFGEKIWYHGDWAFIDEDGFWFLRGRSDDTIKIAGKRVGPNEFESFLMEDARVAEVAAIGLPHEIKGETVSCYVVLKNPEATLSYEKIREELLKLATQKMGKALAPEKIFFVDALPKTRSGKILRGLIRKLILNEKLDDSAVENPTSLEAIRKAH
ncbi:MAG: AMP-binding protein [Deltaproteobacteria bacterium]|nr:AMP-binding protein [Deltaproteobacteria bacterium]